jgi:hypothetical protein
MSAAQPGAVAGVAVHPAAQMYHNRYMLAVKQWFETACQRDRDRFVTEVNAAWDWLVGLTGEQQLLKIVPVEEDERVYDYSAAHTTIDTYRYTVKIELLPEALPHLKHPPDSAPAAYGADEALRPFLAAFDAAAWGNSKINIMSAFKVYGSKKEQQREAHGLGFKGPAPPPPARDPVTGKLVSNAPAAVDPLRLAVARVKAIAAIQWQLQLQPQHPVHQLLEGLQQLLQEPPAVAPPNSTLAEIAMKSDAAEKRKRKRGRR